MLTRLESLFQTRWVYSIAPLLGFLLALPFDFAHDDVFRFLGASAGIIALFFYLLVVRLLTPKRALLFGYLFGLAFFGWGLNWIYISMANFGGAPLAFAILANAAVVAYLALYWLLTSYLIVKLGQTPKQRLLIAPAVIALLEWVRSVFLIGFPWLSLGYGVGAPSAFAPIGGIFFVSFMLVLVTSLFAGVLVEKDSKLNKLFFIAIVGVILLKQFVFPFLSDYSPRRSEHSTTLSLIQGNMPVITEYNDQRMTQNLAQYHTLTDEIVATEKPNVVIWPEAAVPYFYIESTDFLGDIFALQQQHGFDLITGVPHANWDTRDIYNSILLQQATDQKPQFYNKSHLLPFGEYLPFRSVFAFFKDYVDIPMSDFARGEVIQKPFKAGGLTFAPSICFEAVFGDEIRKNAQGAQVLLNLSNDAWFGRSKAQIQHLNIARMRAMENQKMLVRSTNDGRTAIIDANGNIVKAIPPFADGTLTATVYGYNIQTPYAKFGDYFLISLSLACIVALFTFQLRNRKK